MNLLQKIEQGLELVAEAETGAKLVRAGIVPEYDGPAVAIDKDLEMFVGVRHRGQTPTPSLATTLVKPGASDATPAVPQEPQASLPGQP